jgi:RNA polymerase sigma factor (sigma-70 family)
VSGMKGIACPGTPRWNSASPGTSPTPRPAPAGRFRIPCSKLRGKTCPTKYRSQHADQLRAIHHPARTHRRQDFSRHPSRIAATSFPMATSTITISSASGEPVGASDAARWFAEEVQPHEAALRNWLRVRFPAVSDRDDLVQECFMRVWRARAHTRIVSVKAFLFATARNLAIDVVNRRRAEVRLGDSAGSSVLDENCNTVESVARAQEFHLLNQALDSLPERCRQVFVLRRLYGLSQKQIAARLGISEKTVEAQNTIAMHKCVRFFEHLAAAAERSANTRRPVVDGPISSSPQHA